VNKYRYAAYGSNLHPVRLDRRVPSATLLGTDFLPTWSLNFSKTSHVDGTGKCTISEDGDGVYVAVYEIATAEEVILDRCEGLGSGYNSLTLEVPGFGWCKSYIADEGAIDESLVPTDWYREYVLLGCEFNQFPEDYIARVRKVECCQDPDPQRSRKEWELVESIIKCGADHG
jgi:hypothetical protein